MPRISRAATQNLHKDSWDADDAISIKTAPTGFDLERIGGAARKYLHAAEGNAAAVEVVLTPHEETQAKLECAVTGGVFRDEGGHILPYEPGLLLDLSPEDRAFVVSEIDRLWAPWIKKPALTPEAQADADFRPRSADVESAQGATVSPGDAG